MACRRVRVRAPSSLLLALVLAAASLAVPMPILGGTASASSPVACAVDGGTAQNGLKVYPSHGQVLYIDTGQGQEVDAAYIGYRVEDTSASARANIWARVHTFAGGVVQLADPLTATYRVGDIGASATEAAYFLLKADRPTTTDQTHVLSLYDRDPALAGATALYSCTFTFVQVKETIKAAANKVNGVDVVRVQELGGSVTVTVNGQTGTIGSGTSSPDGEVIWFSPAARSSWPAASLVLESTSIRFASNKPPGESGAQDVSSHVDTLIFRNPRSTLTGGKARYYYEATYVFRIRGPVSGNAVALPIAQISSGTQIKHTDIGSITADADSSFTVATPVNVDITKSASAAIGGSTGAYEFTYTLSMENTSSSAISLDQIVDDADADLTFKASSGAFNGSPLAADPVLSGGAYVFQGPFAIPAGATRTLTYVMTAACASGTAFDYANTAYGRIGSQVVGESSSTLSGVRVSGADCGGGTATVADADTAVDPAAVTQPATGITATTATLNGSVHPRGTAGRTVIFQYGTVPDLSASTTVTLSASTAATDFVAVSTALSGLTAGTTYYFRVGIDAIRGEILSFTTAQEVADPTTTTVGVSAIVAGSGSDGTATLAGSFDANLVAGGATPGFQWGQTGTSGSESVCTSTTYGTTQVIQEDTDDNGSLDADITLLGGFPSTLTLDIGSLELNKYYCARSVISWGAGGPVFGDPVLFQVSGTQAITYVANGSTSGTVPTAGSAATGSTVTVSANSGTLARSGWTFAGWNTSPDGSGTTYAAGSGQFTLTGPVTLYANWTATITYDGNTSDSGSVPTDGAAYTAADTITVAAPGGLAKTSSEFAGWNTVADGSGTSYSAGQTLTLPASGAVTLYAIWTTRRTVTYDANGSTSGSAPSPQSVGDGASIALASNTGALTRTGFVFGGWNTAADGSGTPYAEGATLTVGADVTLFARWLVERTVTYDGNGNSSGAVPSPQTVGDGRTVTVAGNTGTLARTGFSFDGWQTTASGGTRYAAGSGTFAATADVTLYARWVAVGGGSGGSSGGGSGGGSGAAPVDDTTTVTPPSTPDPTTRPRIRGPIRVVTPPPAATTPPPAAGPGVSVSPAPGGTTGSSPQDPAPDGEGDDADGPASSGLGALLAPGRSGAPGGGSGRPEAPTSLFGGGGTVDLGDGVRAAADVPAVTGASPSGGAPSGPTTSGESPTATAEARTAVDSAQRSGVRTAADLRAERLAGFAPGTSTVVRIVGARTGARFVVSDVAEIDRRTLIEAIERSVPEQEADFFRLDEVGGADVAPELREWSDREREAANELFVASGLPEPLVLADLEGDTSAGWIPVAASAATYVPGSTVYLTLTSTPVVLDQAIVDEDGTARLSSAFPASILTAGEHRIRLVGIRALDGVSVDEGGEIVLSAELMGEIERFDLGTQSTIAVIGENPSGASHLAVRVVPLVPVAPWWTLLVIALMLVVLAVVRRRGHLLDARGRLVARSLLVLSALPAVIIGWRSTVTVVVWWGLGLMLLAAALIGRMPGPRHEDEGPDAEDRDELLV